MKILVNEKLSKHKMKTPEGYLICTDAILARTGKQQYRKDELWRDAEDGDVLVDVDRPYEEVFSEATLASFENKPITVEHPDVDVDTSNYKDYAVGFVRDVHQGKVDGQDVILGTLVITDQNTIEEIENGEHTELSCGYDCDIVDENNPRQTNIRGNHVALCEQGRAGIARIVDTAVKTEDEEEKVIKYKGLKIVQLSGYTKPIYNVYNKNGFCMNPYLSDNTDLNRIKRDIDNGELDEHINDEIKDSDLSSHYSRKSKPTVKAVAEDIWDHLLNADFSAKEIMDMIKKQDSFAWDKLARHGDTEYFYDDDEVDNYCRKNKSMIFRELKKIFEDEGERAFDPDELEEIGFYDSVNDKESANVRHYIELIEGKIAQREGYELKPNMLLIGKNKSKFPMSTIVYERLRELGYGDSVKDAISNYKGYSVQIKSNRVEVWKNGQKLVETPTEDEAIEWIDEHCDDSVHDAGKYIYLYAKSDIDPQDKIMMRKYGLEILGTNRFENEVNLAVRGDLAALKKFNKEWLGYEMHPLYLYRENQFSGEITRDSCKDDALADFFDLLDDNNIKYDFISGGYGIEFRDNYSYNKAKELGRKVRLSKGVWDDTKLTYHNFASTTVGQDSVKDVEPRSGESKADFIKRFMSETANEYPDEKQRYAIALKYRKGKDSMINDSPASEIVKEIRRTYPQVKIKQYSRGDYADLEFENYPHENDFDQTKSTEWKRFLSYLIKKYTGKDKLFISGGHILIKNVKNSINDDEIDSEISWCKAALANPNSRAAMDAKANYGKDWRKRVKEDLIRFERMKNAKKDSINDSNIKDSSISFYVGQEYSLNKERLKRDIAKYNLTLSNWGSLEGDSRKVVVNGKSKDLKTLIDDWRLDYDDDFRWIVINDSIVVKDSTGEQFNIIKVPGDGFVYLQSRFDGRLAKTYEETFKSKYSYKK